MTVEVHVVTPVREVWSGEVQQLTARGTDGEVGILGGHAPLLVQLKIGALSLLEADGSKTLAVVDGGFLHVSSHDGVTRADVLASHAEMATDIDVAAAQARLEEAQARVAAAGDDREDAAIEVAKAKIRLELAG